MKIEYFGLVDAVNSTADGKMNVLGLGARILTFAGLPGATTATILGSVEADVSEAGPHDLLVELVDPDGVVETVVRDTAVISGDVREPRLPTGLSFTALIAHVFSKEGIYLLRCRFADLETDYAFVVGVAADASSRPKRRRPKTRSMPEPVAR